MKQSGTLFLLIATLLLITLVIIPAAAIAGDHGTAQSLQERAMNAAQQMREYRQSSSTEAQLVKGRSISALQTGVSLHFDKTFKTSSTIFFKDDMEVGINGWTTEVIGGSDLWHQTTMNANSPTHSWWAGVDVQGNYNSGTRVNTALKSPPIDLTLATGAVELLFTENYFTELGWDFCMVDVSTDGGTSWTHLRGGYGTAPSGSSDGWIISSINLTAYAGKIITVRFYFDTGDSLFNDFPGWFVDNVAIFDQGGLITGKTFFDANSNGIKDGTDRGVKDWLVTANGEGITITTRTDYRGKYRLPLPLGTYTITDELKEGWTQTFPQPFPSRWNITMSTPDTLVDSVWFGNFTNASFVNGMIFNDVDKNGSYDAGTDSSLIGWRTILSDTLGNMIDYDYTDSSGVYQIFVFAPGKYVVSEGQGRLQKGWVQSYPPGETYTIDIPNLSTVLNGKDFGNYYSPLANAVIGQKYNDRNRNQKFDSDELGVPGFVIQMRVFNEFEDVIYNRKRTTDSSGYYQFQGVPAGRCEVKEIIDQKSVGWWPSFPTLPYDLVLNNGGLLDSVDFGNYQIVPGSISGMKFNDLDANGIKETGEPGLSGWTLALSGVTTYGTSVSGSMDTDPNGNYQFPVLWPGKYRISELFRSNWRQTYPANLKPQFVDLTPENNLTGIDFGNTLDSNFSLAFRTFLPESLANAVDLNGRSKPIPAKPRALDWRSAVYNDTTLPAYGVIIHTTVQIDSAAFSYSPPGTYQFMDSKGKRIKIAFATPLQSGDSVVLSGICRKSGIQHVSTQKWLTDPALNTRIFWVGHRENFLNIPLLPMPNAINFLQAGAGIGLKVGLGGRHSVVHKRYGDVLKSLKDSHGMHRGDPRCLGTFSGTAQRPIKTQQNFLPPTKHNNKLFAEAIALQANINGSDYGILPGGFGNLIFDEGGENFCNGLTIREIAARLDSMMSLFNDTSKVCIYGSSVLFMDIFNTVRKIDSAFSGPFDTLQFGGGLRLKAVKPLSAVSFLHLDSSFIQMGSFAFKPIPEAIPERFELLQNYPNPFNPSTIIEFYLPYKSFVTLKVYNQIGQEVASLLDRQEMEDGSQEVELLPNAVNLASGVYYYRIVAEAIGDEENTGGVKFTSTKKMMFLK